MGDRAAIVGMLTILVYAGLLALSWPPRSLTTAAVLLFLLAVASDATAVWTRHRGAFSFSFIWLAAMAQLSGVTTAAIATLLASLLTLALWAREKSLWARAYPLLPDLLGSSTSFFVLSVFESPPSHGFPLGLVPTIASLIVYALVAAGTLNFLFRTDSGAGPAAHRSKLKHYRGVAFVAPACVLLGATDPRYTLWMIPLVYGMSQFTWPGHEELQLFESRTLGLRSQLQESKSELKSKSKVLSRTRAEKERTSRALAQLERNKEEMIQVGKMSAVGNLAAGFAHQVNTPLASILVAVEAAQRSLKKGKGELAQKRLEQCKEATKQAQSIVEELLAFARSEDFQSEELSLSRLVRAVAAQRNEILEGGGVQVSYQLDERTVVSGNRALLEQAVANLLDNAVDAMQGGAKRLVLVVRNKEGRAILEVRDSGEGVDPAIQGRIFEPFFSSKPVGKGTGLGLYFSREIAIRHGGSLKLLDSSHRGSTFQLELPSDFLARNI